MRLGNIIESTCIVAKTIIDARLHPYVTLEGWLSGCGITSRKLSYKNVQKHRHAWLDKLSEEFSN